MSSKIAVYLQNHCPMCSTDLSQAKTLINHLKSQHQMELSTRKTSLNRPKDPAYNFVKDQSDAQMERYACPSCWSHFSEPHELEQHLKMHINQGDSNMGEARQHQEDYEEYDEEAAISNNGRGAKDKESDKDAVYLQKSKELFNTLDDLIAGFKKLLPYGHSNEKNGGK